MKIRYFLAILIALSIIISSCNETTNPSDEYLIDKTISASTTEQIVESGTEFKMIFPANSVSGDITLKIKKEGSYPTFDVPNVKLGSNTYRIKFSGNTAFASPVKIIINYDKSQIPAGKTAAEIIQAYIYAGGNWKLATYQLDEPTSKIIISISNLETPKTNKDMPELQGEGDIIITDGTTSINDSGQNDYEYMSLVFKFRGKKVEGDLFDWGFNYDTEPQKGFKGKWTNNTFTVKWDSTVSKGVGHFNFDAVFNSSKTIIESLIASYFFNDVVYIRINLGNIPVNIINNKYQCSLNGISLNSISTKELYDIPIFGPNSSYFYDETSFLNLSVPLKK